MACWIINLLLDVLLCSIAENFCSFEIRHTSVKNIQRYYTTKRIIRYSYPFVQASSLFYEKCFRKKNYRKDCVTRYSQDLPTFFIVSRYFLKNGNVVYPYNASIVINKPSKDLALLNLLNRINRLKFFYHPKMGMVIVLLIKRPKLLHENLFHYGRITICCRFLARFL